MYTLGPATSLATSAALLPQKEPKCPNNQVKRRAALPFENEKSRSGASASTQGWAAALSRATSHSAYRKFSEELGEPEVSN